MANPHTVSKTEKPWQRKALEFFNASRRRVFTRKELFETLNANRTELNAPLSLSGSRFLNFLRQDGDLLKVELTAEPPADQHQPAYKSFIRYTWGNASALEVALSLRSRSYLTHATSVFLHGLTNQIPKTIYANKEQTPKPSGGGLTQDGINRAFANNQRTSNYIFRYQDCRIVLLSGKNTSRLQVIFARGPNDETLEVTGLERTLIDITVRPTYAGGVVEVLKAFRAAREILSIETLIATLRKLDYVYPYHQAIGFYMEKAGYDTKSLDRVRAFGLNFDFYLTNKIPDPLFNSSWRIYYPKEL